MTGWRRALVAAATVEAAAGVAAASVANAVGNGHEPGTVFITCTLGVATADMVLVPGWVWATRPSVPLRLFRRLLAVVLTLAAAVWMAAWASFAVLAAGAAVFTQAPSWLPGVVLFGLPFLVAGAVAGLGATVAERWDWRPGIVLTRWRSHVVGGVVGVVVVFLLATIADKTDAGDGPNSGAWWPLLALAPAALVLGGGVHNALMARDAIRTETVLADHGPMVGRTLACSAPLLALAAIAALFTLA